jgi:hypothetical protein
MDLLIYPIFFIVGAVVSLDVAGLTLTQTDRFVNEERSILLWAITNGFWHAALLFAYILVISEIFHVSFNLLDWLGYYIKELAFLKEIFGVNYALFAASILNLFKEHIFIILGLVTLIIVWTTYSSKITETPDLGDREKLPMLAKFLYDVLELAFSIRKIERIYPKNVSDFLHWQAQAALVAVDMLALAALMKAMGYMNTFEHQITLVIIVFFTVSAICLLVGVKAKRRYKTFQMGAKANVDVGQDAKNWLLITIRIAEPMFIFYFTLELIAFLIFEERKQSVAFVLGAGLLLIALIRRHGLLAIVAATISKGSSKPAPAPRRKPKDILWNFVLLILTFLKWIAIILLIIFTIVLLSPLAFDTPQDISSLDTYIGKIISGISLILLIGSFSKCKLIKPLERNLIRLFMNVYKLKHAWLFIVGAIIIASIIPIIDAVSENTATGDKSYSIYCPKELGFKINHIHALQVSLWMLWLLAMSYCMKLTMIIQRINIKKCLTEKGKATRHGMGLVKPMLSVCFISIFLIALLQEHIKVWFEAVAC